LGGFGFLNNVVMDDSFSTKSVKFSQVHSNIVATWDSNEIHKTNEISMKSQKGTVVIRAIKGRLRLVWSFCGKRYFFALELPDTKANRAIAQMKAKQIERDIANDLFDPTLEKYRAAYQRRTLGLSAVEVFEKYIAYKAKTLKKRSLEKYTFTLSHLQQFFRDGVATEAKCEEFKDWLANRMEPITLKQRISFLKSAWAWAIEKKLVTENPWIEALRQVKVPPKQRPRPFTRDERQRIVAAFRRSPDYSYYADYVEFLLAAGCRPGEACALKWKHITDDFTLVWVGEAYSRGEVGATKTNEQRFLRLTARLQDLMKSRRSPDAKPDDLVFPAARGGYIDDHNFRNRAWKTVLGKLEIDYRKPYNMRHTFVSASLDQGLPPTVVSSLSGHTVETLYRSYAGNVRGLVELPEL
jgi:integrase